jgi:glucose/mannose-6-phosphate isomerase
MLADLAAYGEHWADATAIGEAFELDRSVLGARQIVWTGMGGSAIGGDVLRAVAGEHLNVPMSINRDYHLPKFVDEDTLVIAASYSGNTEETLAAVAEARERGAKLLGIATGGELHDVFVKSGMPFITIPGGMQPRVGLIFLFAPLLIALSRLEYIDWEAIADAHAETGAAFAGLIAEYQQEEENPALDLAEGLHHLLPVVYASNHLEAILVRWRAQINENAKTLAFFHVLPEMNHNEIVGWYHPTDVLKRTHVVFLRDTDEAPRMSTRLEITEQMLRDEGCAKKVSVHWSRGESRMARLFSLIVFGDFMSYYLALVNGADPSPVDRITRFKDTLSAAPA